MKMKPLRPHPCRLFAIPARGSPRIVVFRRGPSKWTELIVWHTDTDLFEQGQWFHGRVYERRCDLSPDGTKLLYFVSKFNKRTLKDKSYTYAWTAISRPPYFTALALWPKGDCWHGGGLFEDDVTVLLNHRPEVSRPHRKHQPKGIEVRANPEAQGEDDPIFGRRLTRDGWTLQQEWKGKRGVWPVFWITESPEVRVKKWPLAHCQIVMNRRIDHFKYREEFSIVDHEGHRLADTEKALWVDWDQNGRLFMLRDGKLFLQVGSGDQSSIQMKETYDFNPSVPRPVKTPTWAAEW